MSTSKGNIRIISPEDFLVLSAEQQARFLDMTQQLADAAFERIKRELDQGGYSYSLTDADEIKSKYTELMDFIHKEYTDEMRFLKTNGFSETVEMLAAKKNMALDDFAEIVDDMGEAEFYENIRAAFFPQNRRSLQMELELLDTFMPKTFYIPNSKVANTLTNPRVPLNEDFYVQVDKDKDISVQVALIFDDKNIQIIEKEGMRLTPFDRSVLNSVCSRFEAGNLTFTPDQIYRTMNGLTDREFVSEESKTRIVESIDKMRFLEIKIDYTDEAVKMYKQARPNDTKKYVVSGYLLAANKAELTTSNGNVQGYKLLEKPIIYTYSQHNEQIISVPIKMLNTKDYIRTTPEVVVIREYLIRRIEVMKNAKKRGIKMSNRILLDSIYEELELNAPTKEKAKKIRDASEKLLTKFKDDKDIKGFEFCKKGRAYHGIDIHY